MKQNILIINICKEKLHYYEFVKPIEDILKNLKKEKKINYFINHYKDLKEGDLRKSSRVIICGTSLADNKFVDDINKFRWLLNYNKPVLGICGGMEIIGLVFKGKLKRKTEESKSFLKKKTEIGFYKECFNKNFLGLLNEQEVYHLHNYYIDFNLKEFEFYCFSDGSNRKVGQISQAVKHKEKQIYGVLFHPEVRQKNLIKEFCEL